MSAFQTDSLNPSALPSSTLGRRRAPAATTSAFDADPSSSSGPSKDPDAAAREQFHEEWNVRIDKEVKALAGGLREIVDRADIGTNPSAHASTPVSLHLRLRTAQLIRSAQSLRDMSHELRLMLLLSDEVDLATRRDAEVKVVREELAVRRGRVDGEIRSLLSGENGLRSGEDQAMGEEGELPEVEEEVEEQVEEIENAGRGMLLENTNNVEGRARSTGASRPDDGSGTGGTQTGMGTQSETGAPAEPEDDDDDFEEV